MELVDQKHDDTGAKQPQECDVKDQSVQLNEYLKSDYTKDEPQITNSDQKTRDSDIEYATTQNNIGDFTRKPEIDNDEELNKKQFVVERDGQFSVVSVNELTATELNMFIDDTDNHTKSSSSKAAGNGTLGGHTPKPPSRPKSVPVSRNFNHLPRPKSTGQINYHRVDFSKFSYSSPYAMTLEQKEAAKEEARMNESEKREKERINKLNDEERKIKNHQAFQYWLNVKKEQDKERKEKQENEKNLRTSDGEKRKESKKVYKNWLKEKKSQIKHERLLKRQQQYELTEGLNTRTHEECERAFLEWLKRKNAEARNQQWIEKQRNRLLRIQMKQSKKILTFMKVLKDAEAALSIDYYGFRF